MYQCICGDDGAWTVRCFYGCVASQSLVGGGDCVSIDSAYLLHCRIHTDPLGWFLRLLVRIADVQPRFTLHHG